MSRAGIPRAHIVIDPGSDSAKRWNNLDLLANLRRITDIGLPVLAGLSRKAMLGTITGRDVDHRQVRVGCRRSDRGPERCLGAAGTRRGRNGRCYRGAARDVRPWADDTLGSAATGHANATSSAARSAAAFTSVS